MSQEKAILFSKIILSLVTSKVNEYNTAHPENTVSLAKVLNVFKDSDNILNGLINFNSYFSIASNGINLKQLKIDNNGEISFNKEENEKLALEFITANELDKDFLITELYLNTPKDSKLERLQYILAEDNSKHKKQKYLEI